jgi:hypothetical protein
VIAIAFGTEEGHEEVDPRVPEHIRPGRNEYINILLVCAVAIRLALKKCTKM